MGYPGVAAWAEARAGAGLCRPSRAGPSLAGGWYQVTTKALFMQIYIISWKCLSTTEVKVIFRDGSESWESDWLINSLGKSISHFRHIDSDWFWTLKTNLILNLTFETPVTVWAWPMMKKCLKSPTGLVCHHVCLFLNIFHFHFRYKFLWFTCTTEIFS